MHIQTDFSIHIKKSLSFAYLLSVCLLIAFYIAPADTQAVKNPVHSDFIKLYKSTVFFWKGENIYQPVPVLEFKPFHGDTKIKNKNIGPNLNPPLLTLLISPLGQLSYRDAFVTWWLLSIACGLGATILVWATVGPTTPIALASLLTLILVYFPTMMNMMLGQLGLFVFFFCALAWRALHAGKERVAGISLGMAFGLKLFVGFFLIMLITQQRWIALKWFLSTFLAGIILAGIFIGFESYSAYITALSQVDWYAASWNGSVLGFFSRIFGGSNNLPMFDWPILTHSLNYLFAAGLTLANLLLASSTIHENRQVRLDLAFALSIISMLLLSPLGWIYYFPVLLIPFWLLWNKLGHCQLGAAPRSLLVIAWFLSTIPSPLLPSTEANNPAGWFFYSGTYFYSQLLFLALLLFAAKRLRLIEPRTPKDLIELVKHYIRYLPCFKSNSPSQ